MKLAPEGTLDRAAWDYIVADDIARKLEAPEVGLPPATAVCPPPPTTPGRPPGIVIHDQSAKTPKAGALRSALKRAQLMHTFFHHELQAAELMCWAVLAFPEAPPEFRRGLMGICGDEVRHMSMYRDHLRALGHEYGDFPVRDWFWERIPRCASEVHFVATLGMGFEGANLDHARRFAGYFRQAGDEQGAQIIDRVGAEEVAHVRFALRWFRQWTGGDDFDDWVSHLPAPLSPILMRGRPINEADRLTAGLSAQFVARLRDWVAH